jgi:transcription elongation GreA/GreB family factor
MTPEARSELIRAWRQVLEDRLQSLGATQSSAREGTRVDGSHRPSNRGERAAVTSQAYLAHGLQQRMEKLGEQLRLLEEMGSEARDRVVVGAWIEIETEQGERRQIAVFPGGDATRLVVGGDPVQVLSPSSPLLQPLLGLEEGEGAEVRGLGAVEICRIG